MRRRRAASLTHSRPHCPGSAGYAPSGCVGSQAASRRYGRKRWPAPKESVGELLLAHRHRQIVIGSGAQGQDHCREAVVIGDDDDPHPRLGAGGACGPDRAPCRRGIASRRRHRRTRHCKPRPARPCVFTAATAANPLAAKARCSRARETGVFRPARALLVAQEHSAVRRHTHSHRTAVDQARSPLFLRALYSCQRAKSFSALGLASSPPLLASTRAPSWSADSISYSWLWHLPPS